MWNVCGCFVLFCINLIKSRLAMHKYFCTILEMYNQDLLCNLSIQFRFWCGKFYVCIRFDKQKSFLSSWTKYFFILHIVLSNFTLTQHQFEIVGSFLKIYFNIHDKSIFKVIFDISWKYIFWTLSCCPWNFTCLVFPMELLFNYYFLKLFKINKTMRSRSDDICQLDMHTLI